ncbi:MAG: hypothetical protein U9N86_09435 [Bacteroidota bacterium]|nr:hypothetical protein [Bacteroidota bacterium]
MKHKNINKQVIFFMALIMGISACKETEFADPIINFIPEESHSEQAKGKEVTFSVNLFADAGLASLEVLKNNSVYASKTYTEDQKNVLYTFSYTVEDLLNEGDEVVFDFTLTDQADKQATSSYTIAVKADPVPSKLITDKNAGGTGTTTWHKDTVYILDGFVFVNNGQVLTIEGGTIIKCKAGQAEDATALIVARGGKIMAEGRADAPIIFTAESDNIMPGELMGSSLDAKTNGLWGGLIVLGRSSTNNTTLDKAIEGIPTSETRGQYGGTNIADNSGIIRYVSIRHAGTLIGAENEINGLTLGAVGSGTIIEYVEVFANQDDGVEFFGGTVNTRYMICAFNNDDSFDYDEGFSGKGQFWFVVQDPGVGDRIGEHDGGPKDNEFGTPYAIPQIFNVSYVGRGAEAGTRLMTMRDNAGGKYKNSIFIETAKGIDIEYIEGSDNSYLQYENGNLEITNNIFWKVGDGTGAGIFNVAPAKDTYTVPAEYEASFDAYFESAGNQVSDPGISGDNPVPQNDVSSNMADYPADWFTQVNYKGAFDPNGTNWAKGWTLLDASGFLK